MNSEKLKELGVTYLSICCLTRMTDKFNITISCQSEPPYEFICTEANTIDEIEQKIMEAVNEYKGKGSNNG